jgi:hypothetical protein
MEGLPRKVKTLRFVNVPDYVEWEEKMQLESFSFFSKHGGDHTNWNKDEVTSYKFCQFNPEFKSHARKDQLSRKTDRKLQRGPIPKLNCQAKIVAIFSNSSVTVHYYYEHNHPLRKENLQFQPLPDSIKWSIREMIGQGLEVRRIMQNLEDVKWHRVHRNADKSAIPFDNRDSWTQR